LEQRVALGLHLAVTQQRSAPAADDRTPTVDESPALTLATHPDSRA